MSLMPASWDVMENPGELMLVMLISTSGHPSWKAGCKTRIPKTHPGAGKPSYQFTLSNRDAQRGSSLRLPCESLPSGLIILSGDFFTTTKRTKKGFISVLVDH